MQLSLSVLEKHLLRQGLALRDECDARSNLVTTWAQAPGGATLCYPKPVYIVPGRDRAADAQALLAAMASLEGRSAEAVARDALDGLGRTLPGYACIRCGRCCTRIRDAFQGRVSPEEVEDWAVAKQDRILRLVDRVDRGGYSFYRAWINPGTGRFFQSCPWLRRGPNGLAGCRIHEHKPIKCRAFPFSLDHAARAGCPGAPEAAPDPPPLARALDHDRGMVLPLA